MSEVAALKEQNAVCEALGRGLVVAIARKGGIEDETSAGLREALVPQPDRPFLLLPTRFHEADDTLRPVVRESLADLPAKPPEAFCCRYVARCVDEFVLREPERLDVLAELQPFTSAVLQERFDYREPGLVVLVLQTLRLPEPLLVPDDERVAGCRSWVTVDAEAERIAAARPVLEQTAMKAAYDRVRIALGE